MNIQIASPDHISKLLAFIAVKAKGTRFEIPASLLHNVESELRDFCKARRITVQFKEASTERVIVFCAAGAATGTVVGAMCGGVLGALTGTLLGSAVGAALAQIRITVYQVEGSDNLVLTLA
ncbi:hypothetical protein L584_21595 [Pantoea agglomerans Tx10]|uniref:hypothetical protein n=1 Tax=Enterobacter agglomerans TaxID=549 RepID=UPI0003B24184|nr:hypothetical protein [Pantoea agglomerans]ERM08565.1 hypothetical protein L584_21595 [Pantoea agglomerans Tx10]NEG67315.1 hypothetical protein [Pantoea agglomerans]WVL85245.1 hypothetical protein IFU02_022800 [Pantoea agglomerans]